MQPDEIYAKTEAGVEEVKGRRLKLPVALRSLLIMVDGNLTAAQLIGRGRALGLTEQSLVELERAGLIALRFSGRSAAASPGAAAPRPQDQVDRFIAGQRMISDAINEHLGFRGYGLMLRLQRAGNLRDLHDLMPDLGQALVKRIGANTAAAVLGALERLLATGPS
jgi:hypothetical protein